jgi:hypothetical protein
MYGGISAAPSPTPLGLTINLAHTQPTAAHLAVPARDAVREDRVLRAGARMEAEVGVVEAAAALEDDVVADLSKTASH